MSASGFHFFPEWRTTVLVVLLTPFLIGLGFWQLDRADEKAELAALFEQRQRLSPALVTSVWNASPSDLAYLPVKLQGHFLKDQYLLLDNRMREGRFGYEVFGIFLLSDVSDSPAGDAVAGVLVNRGWIAGDAARQSLPEVPPVTGELELTGQVYVAPGAPFLLAEQQLQSGWPKLIQAVEMDKFRAVLEGPVMSKLFPYPVRIGADQRGAMRADWQVVNISPQKHVGYAVQWFTMAAVLVLIYIFSSSNLRQVLTGSQRKQG
jgi:surfeit locus 1 family protein